MKSRRKNYLNIFRFIDDLTSINDSCEFETDNFNIYPEEIQLVKETANKH